MSDGAPIPENIRILLRHLKEGSLAFSLVKAYTDPDAEDQVKAMKDILEERVKDVRNELACPEEVKNEIDSPED